MSDLLRRYPDPELARLQAIRTEESWRQLHAILSQAFELIDRHPEDDAYRGTIERWVRLTYMDWLADRGWEHPTTRQIATRLGVSPGRVSQLRAEWRDGPPKEPKHAGRPKRRRQESVVDFNCE